MKPMFTIIIPAYNAADTVKKSVASCLSQKGYDHEVIAIDDGSTDGTLSILESLEENHPEFELIKQSHKGAAAARNAGIRAAKGEYLYFADADDLMAENALEMMKNALKEHPCDLLTFGFRKVNAKKNTVEEISAPKGLTDGATIKADYTSFGEKADFKVIGSCWNKVFRKDLVTEHEIWFPEELKRNEEEVFIMRYLDACKEIYNIPDLLYEFYPIDMEKAERVMTVNFARDVEQFRLQRLFYAGKWNCDNEKTRSFIASEFWGKMMLALRLDKKRGDFSHFKEHAAMLLDGLKDTGCVPGGIKKSKTYMLLKIHMLKQVYHSL